jgi:HPt (histidine-containing phosphotransfer) domain-containing protein
MENTKIYNLDYLKEISAGDEDFFNHIIGEFIESAPNSMQEITRLAENQQWPELYQAVHKFASSISLLGMDGIVSLIDEIEKKSKFEKQTDTIQLTVNELNKEISQALSQLKEEY